MSTATQPIGSNEPEAQKSDDVIGKSFSEMYIEENGTDSFTGETTEESIEDIGGIGTIHVPGRSDAFPGEDVVVKALEKVRRGTTSRPDRDRGLIKYYMVPLNNNWVRSMDAVLDLAQWCASAKRNLDEVQYRKVLKTLPFGKATFSKLSAIGESERIRKYASRLPCCYSILYELSKLDGDAWEKMVDAGAVKPELTRSKVLEFAKTKKSKAATSKASARTVAQESEISDFPEGHLFAEIVVTRDGLPDEALALLKAKLAEIGEIAGVSVQYEEE